MKYFNYIANIYIVIKEKHIIGIYNSRDKNYDK